MAEDNIDRDSHYDDLDLIAARVKSGHHRNVVGGMWEEVGKLQFDFLIDHGLQRTDNLLDIGCGSLRGGVYFAKYLEANHYWGLDINESLLTAGYDQEIIPLGLAEKVSRANLIVDGEFDFSLFAQSFEFAIAQSLFTHLNGNKIKLCLQRLSKVMLPGRQLFATFFIAPEGVKSEQFVKHSIGGIVTYSFKDPFHYSVSEVENLIQNLPWRIKWIGDWNHPRDQKMVILERLEESTGDERDERSIRELDVEGASSLSDGSNQYRAMWDFPTDRDPAVGG